MYTLEGVTFADLRGVTEGYFRANKGMHAYRGCSNTLYLGGSSVPCTAGKPDSHVSELITWIQIPRIIHF